MTQPAPTSQNEATSDDDAEADFQAHARRVCVGADRLFGVLMLVQLVACVGGALWFTPYTWNGDTAELHTHVWAAMSVGAAATLFPALLCWRRPGEPTTRYAVAVAQMVVASLLIHISGGRIEMHFHVFGSLAFLAAYRDWRVIVIASVTIAVDHIARGVYWPYSVFGVEQPALWRALEHAGWVVFEDIILLISVAQATREMRSISMVNAQMRSLCDERDAHAKEVEWLNAELEQRVRDRTHELEAEGRLLESLINGLPNAVFWKNTAGVYIGCNQAFADFVRVASPSEVVGRQDGDLGWSPDTLDRKLRAELDVLRTDVPVIDAELTETLETGESYEVIASKTVLRDWVGRASGVVGIYTDVSELNRLRSKLEQSEKLQAVGQLAAGIAHEINTPMQFIGSNVSYLSENLAQWEGLQSAVRALLDGRQHGAELERLRESLPSEEALQGSEEALADCRMGVERVSEIIGAMREFAHPGNQDRVPFDINRCVRNAATLTKNATKLHAVVELDLADCALVQGSASAMSQALVNLIVNATDAIEEASDGGAVAGRITVSTGQVEDRVIVRVADTGCGMPPEVAAKAFDPFFTTKGVGKGSGQGLAIAYNAVVEKCGGQISIDSSPGEGTTFTISLAVACSPSKLQFAAATS